MIDWKSLLTVGIVSVCTTALFALLLALSIRLLAPSKGTTQARPHKGATTAMGWFLLALIGIMLAIAIWLVIPHFD